MVRDPGAVAEGRCLEAVRPGFPADVELVDPDLVQAKPRRPELSAPCLGVEDRCCAVSVSHDRDIARPLKLEERRKARVNERARAEGGS